MKKNHKVALAVLVFLAVVFLAWYLGRIFVPEGGQSVAPAAENREKAAADVAAAIVTKVIDGDTVVVAGGDHVRLLGVDADEKDYPCYDAARLRLEKLVLGKTVRLEADREDADQYGRRLRYVFFDGVNINEELAAEGLAVARFYPENQKYKTAITAAEAKAIENKIGCKWNGREQDAAVEPENEAAAENKNFTWQKIFSDNIVSPCDADDHIGEEVVVEGIVADAYRSASDTVFLNFDKKYPDNCFAAVIFKDNLANFPGAPEEIYNAKTVRVKGKVQVYQNKPEIILDVLSQIEIGK